MCKIANSQWLLCKEKLFKILAHFASPFSFERRYQNSLCRSTLHRCKHDSPWPCEWSANAKMQNSQVRWGKALLVFFSTDGCAIYLSAKSKQRMGWKTSWKDEKLHNNENLLIVSGRIFFHLTMKDLITLEKKSKNRPFYGRQNSNGFLRKPQEKHHFSFPFEWLADTHSWNVLSCQPTVTPNWLSTRCCLSKLV